MHHGARRTPSNSFWRVRPSAVAASTAVGASHAAQSSGFGEPQLEALSETAKLTNTVVFDRPANPVTNVTEMQAVLQGLLAVYKSMADKSKSGSLGGALKRQKSVKKDATGGAGAEDPAGDASIDNFTKQKIADLEYASAAVSLDILHYLQRVNRLSGKLTLFCETITIRDAHSDRARDETSYYLEYKFHETFKSAKTNKIRVRIPEAWVKSDASVVEVRGTILTDAYDERIAELEKIRSYFAELNRPTHASSSAPALATQIPPALFRIWHTDKSTAEIEKEWRRIFEEFRNEQLFLSEALFETPDRLRPRSTPTFGTTYRVVVDDTDAKKKTQLHAFVQTASLPMVAPASLEHEHAFSLPWSAQAGYKLLSVDGTPTPALMCSDLDKAGIAYPKTKSFDTTLVDLATETDGYVTGIGLKKDAEIINTLNQQYLKALQKCSDKYAGSLEGEFYRKQLEAGIIAAHHGAENLNPYATTEVVEQAFAEGFIFVYPNGNKVFLQGIGPIFDKLNELAKEYIVPISSLWYEVLKKFGEDNGKPIYPKTGTPLDPNLVAIDAKAHAVKKTMDASLKAAYELEKVHKLFKDGIYFDYTHCSIDGKPSDLHSLCVQGIHSVFKELVEWAEVGRKVTVPHQWHTALSRHVIEKDIKVDRATFANLIDGGEVPSFTIDGLVFADPKAKRSFTSKAAAAGGAGSATTPPSYSDDDSSSDTSTTPFCTATATATAAAPPCIAWASEVGYVLSNVQIPGHYEGFESKYLNEVIESLCGYFNVESSALKSGDYSGIRSDNLRNPAELLEAENYIKGWEDFLKDSIISTPSPSPSPAQ